ncbi:MAG: DNA polymerase III subunit delta' [Alphaproteobacteria bacterium]
MSEETDLEVLPPRANPALIGHGAAERTLVEASRSGRLAHAWLITGPRGIGKATLAHRFARFLLAGAGARQAGAHLGEEAPTLPVAPEHPVFRRMVAGGHADFRVVERGADEKTGRVRSEIVIDDVRELGGFLRLTPAEGGHRVVIIDSADEMNRNAANAVLKILEEPPAKAVLLLVSHAPARLLATIRSRCRRLALSPLGESDLRAAILAQIPLADGAFDGVMRLAEGSPGRAFELLSAGGMGLYRDLVGVLASLPALDLSAANRFMDETCGRGADDSFILATDLLRGWHARLLRGAATGRWTADLVEGDSQLMRRLARAGSLDRWFEVWDKNDRLFRRADSLNLDHRQVLLSAFLALENAARA